MSDSDSDSNSGSSSKHSRSKSRDPRASIRKIAYPRHSKKRQRSDSSDDEYDQDKEDRRSNSSKRSKGESSASSKSSRSKVPSSKSSVSSHRSERRQVKQETEEVVPVDNIVESPSPVDQEQRDEEDLGHHGMAMESRMVQQDAIGYVNPEAQEEVIEPDWKPLSMVSRTLEGWVDKYEIADPNVCPACMFGMTQQTYAVGQTSNCNVWAEIIMEMKNHRSSVNWFETIEKIQRLYHDKIKSHLFRKVKKTLYDHELQRDEVFYIDEPISDASDWAGQKIYEHLRGYHVINKERILARIIETQESVMEKVANHTIIRDANGIQPDKLNLKAINIYRHLVRELRTTIKDLREIPDMLVSGE
jgi:hypothetical protein